MSRKTVAFGAKPPSPAASATAEEWVSGQPEPEQPQQSRAAAEAMKRLTIDVSESLHTRIKVQCAQRGVKIADEVRALLERHFSGEGSTTNGHKGA